MLGGVGVASGRGASVKEKNITTIPPVQLGLSGGNSGKDSERPRNLAAQKSHRKIAVTTVAASGLASIPLQKSQGFFASPAAKKSLAASDFWGWPQNRRKIAATTAASRRSRAISRPQRPRDTKPRKRSQSFSWKSPREHGWEPLKP